MSRPSKKKNCDSTLRVRLKTWNTIDRLSTKYQVPKTQLLDDVFRFLTDVKEMDLFYHGSKTKKKRSFRFRF